MYIGYPHIFTSHRYTTTDAMYPEQIYIDSTPRICSNQEAHAARWNARAQRTTSMSSRPRCCDRWPARIACGSCICSAPSRAKVNEIARELGLNQAAASQHLAAMRSVGLVEAIRDGRTVRYRLADPQILAACELMRAVLVRRLSRLGDLAAAAHEPALTALLATEVPNS